MGMNYFELINYFLGLLLISTVIIYVLKSKLSLKAQAITISILAVMVYLFLEKPGSLI
jgi:hypothetical protein